MVKVQQRGLGKGLSALISENYTNAAPATAESSKAAAKEGAATPEAPTELAIGTIVPGKFQPRSRFRDEQLKELSESIAKNGVMQPILVRPIKRAGTRETYEIVAGERRWRAAAMAGLATIPVIIRALADEQALELALIENIQRADLTPLEEAAGYQRLIEEFGHTQEELSKIIGKSRSHIANLLRLLALPEELKTLLDEDKLSMGHARALIGIQNAVEIAEAVVKRGLSVRQTEDLARETQGQKKQPRARSGATGNRQTAGREPAPSAKDPDILMLEEALTTNLGLRVTISDRGQAGEVVIAYESLQQLDDILKRLGDGSF